jgi:micrococcal nuclease
LGKLLFGSLSLVIFCYSCGIPNGNVNPSQAEPTISDETIENTEPPLVKTNTQSAEPVFTPAITITSTINFEPIVKSTPTVEYLSTEARVVEVIDGDTIKVEFDGNVYSLRYIGIDTPETVHPSKPVEWMGKEATEANRNLVENQIVYLEQDISDTDQYDRLLRYVYLTDGTFVNLELVRMGFAHASAYPPDIKYQGLFNEAQQEAAIAGIGLWGATPTPEGLFVQATPTLNQSSVQSVVISNIYYDGQVSRVESDEYAIIKNTGSTEVNIGGWRLNAGNPGQDFRFPNHVLAPGAECRVYTNQLHSESCGFSFGSGQAIWNNKGDCGYLYNASGTEVSNYCY